MITLRSVLNALTAEGFVPVDRHDEIAAAAVMEALESPTPWYIRAFAGISAWIAAILLLVFLYGMNLIRDDIGTIVLGVVLCGAAIGLRRSVRSSTFAGQLALALSLTGQVLIIGGVSGLTNSTTAAALAAVVLELILIALYPDPLHRFLSTPVIVGALAVIVFDHEVELALQALVIANALGVLLLWQRESHLVAAGWDDYVHPVGYGLVASLLALVTIQLADDIALRYWWISVVALLIMLIVQVYGLLTTNRVPIDGRLAAALIVGGLVLGAAAFDTPGLLAALIVLLLGFSRGDRLLMGVAAMFLVVFTVAFYYTLALTLLLKSLALIGSGLGLFGVRWAMQQFWARQEAA